MNSHLSLAAQVVSLLRCPACRSPLDCAGEECVCEQAGCGSRYPVVDGIPILINERNSLFSISGFVARRATTSPERSKLARTLGRLLPTTGANVRAKRNYARLAGMLTSRTSSPTVLVVGGSILGQGIEALSADPRIRLIETDVSFGPRAKLICDAHDLPFADSSLDGVVAQAVLEHVVDPFRCVAEMHRVLKPGGIAYAETPFMYAVHGREYDFTRFTLLGHRRLFRAFSEVDSGAVCGPGMTLANAWLYFLLSFTGRKAPRKMLQVLARLTAWFWKYFDYVLVGKDSALDAASGVFFLGTKSETTLEDTELVKCYRGGFG